MVVSLFDKKSINNGLLLGLTFEEMTGLLTHDRAKPAHPHTLHGAPVWTTLASGLPSLAFDRYHPDWLDCPAVDTADLDFTSGDFSLATWVNIRDLGHSSFLICRGVENVDGWFLALVGSRVRLQVNQLAMNLRIDSFEGELFANTWYLVGATRSGSVGKVFINGRDRTDSAEALTDPTATNRELHIAIADDEASFEVDGYMAGGPCGPRVWGRKVEDLEWPQMFESERHWLGV